MMFEFKKFKNLFLEDFEENLQQLTQGLLRLEKKPDDLELLNTLLRIAHNIKGASASVGFEKTAFVAQKIEEIFDAARKKTQSISSQTISTILTLCDFFAKDKEHIQTTGQELDNKDALAVLEQKSQIQKFKPATAFVEEQVKISKEQLDFLMKMVGDLLIHSRNFSLFTKAFREKHPNAEETQELTQLYRNFSLNLDELKFFVRDISLVKLEYLFTTLPRLVRDGAQLLGKNIQLELSGENIKIDRMILSKLYDSLVHIIRNAMDHGIEKKGTISISAEQAKDYVVFSISDNGRGMDFPKMIALAMKKKLISEEEKTALEKWLPLKKNVKIPAPLVDLLTKKYLSSEEKPTPFSGRGVGLSQVRMFVDSVGGSLDIINKEQGTTFVLRLPYSISLIKVLLVKVGEIIFGIPLTSIKEIKPYKENSILGQKNQKILAGMFFPNLKVQHTHYIFIKHHGQDGMLTVDGILGEQDILLQPLPGFLCQKNFFLGSAVLDSGNIAFILDVAAVV